MARRISVQQGGKGGWFATMEVKVDGCFVVIRNVESLDGGMSFTAEGAREMARGLLEAAWRLQFGHAPPLDDTTLATSVEEVAAFEREAFSRAKRRWLESLLHDATGQERR